MKFNKKAKTITVPVEKDGEYIPVDRAKYKKAMEAALKKYTEYAGGQTKYGKATTETRYKNTEYGFTVSMPDGFKYYPVLKTHYESDGFGLMEKELIKEEPPKNHDAVSCCFEVQRAPTAAEQKTMKIKADFTTAKSIAEDHYALRQHRTTTGKSHCRTSACRFSVILHRNFLIYDSIPAKFLYNLTKNLTTHLYDNGCSVLP